MDLPILDLPGSVVTDLCLVLDSGAEHNWRRLVECVPDYTHMDIMELSNLAQQGLSPSRELLMNLNSQGWTLQELADAAKQAGVLSVVQILSTYCEDEGIDFVLNRAHKPSSWLGARSCFHRSTYSDEIAPPISNTEEAVRRYGIPHTPLPSVTTCPPTSTRTWHEKPVTPVSSNTSSSATSSAIRPAQAPPPPVHATPTKPHYNSIASSTSSFSSSSSSSSFEAPSGLEEVRYEVLLEATWHFDQTPYKEGGHKVGEGGFGEVFQCSLMLSRGRVHVAVKALLNQNGAGGSMTSTGSVDSVDRQQFSTETQALSRLSHECLLPVLAYSCDGPRLCLIYPFMINGSLEAHLPNQATLPPGRRLTVARDVGSALCYLHTMPQGQVVHRDVKSANILLSEDWRGKLGDFGLARVLPAQQHQQHSSQLTTTIVGTHVYMAPETRGGTITAAADVYAFGMVLYELLTGKCALNKVETESGEDTDLLSYLEEYEGEQSDLLVGGAEAWDEATQETLWATADQCILKKNKRPTSTEVYQRLESLCS